MALRPLPLALDRRRDRSWRISSASWPRRACRNRTCSGDRSTGGRWTDAREPLANEPETTWFCPREHSGDSHHSFGPALRVMASQAGLYLIVRHGMRLALVGIGAGLLAATSLTRLMASLLYDVKPTDAATFAAVAFGMALAALAACCAPRAPRRPCVPCRQVTRRVKVSTRSSHHRE